MSKLEKLAEIEGTDDFEMLVEASLDSVVPGICTNKDCDYTCSVEPDQDRGFCENCQTQTVKSCLILAELI